MKEESTYRDRELFERIAEGDEEAFTQLYNNYSPKLAAYIGSLLSSDLWAEELVQDVFLKLWLARNSLTGVDHPQAFLFRMAANRTWDHLKKNTKEVQLQYRIGRLEEGTGKNFTEEQMDLKISEELYKEAIKQLPAQRRIAYELKHEEGLSYEEIAGRLGISKNTVRNQIVAASQSVRTYMIEKGDHIRFQDINVAYSIEEKNLKKSPFKTLSFYAYFNNIGIIWKAKHAGLDPDYETPPPISYSFGLRASF